MDYSDENHDFTATDIIQYLEDEYGITAERRSIYRDIDALQEVFDFDIESKQGGHFRLTSRQFEFADLQIIAECIDAAKFISADKAHQLVENLGELCSEYQRDELINETFVCNRAKTTQKGILINISKIREAMARLRDGQPHTPQKITFKYMEHSIKDINTLIERRNGSLYKVSPHKMLMNDGNYYLLGFDDKSKKFKHYRIDRMNNINIIDEVVDGENEFAEIDIETYTKRVFSMYSGKDERVSIRFINPLLDTVIERFGTESDVHYSIEDDSHFVVSTHIEISDQFYGWICGFGRRAKIISPPEAVENFKAYLEKVTAMYQ